MNYTAKDMRKIAELGDIQIVRLRQDIVLGSYFILDYENRYNLNPYAVSDFFDGFEDFIREYKRETKDPRPFDLFDTPEMLREWRDMVACTWGECIKTKGL